MNLSSFFVNKCFEYLLKEERETSEQGEERPKNEIFPPWASGSKTFKKLCVGCGKCAAACKENLIIIEVNGLPVINFANGSCTFCGDCARSCSHGALHFSDEQPPWYLNVSINENCLTKRKVLCQLCQEQCGQRAIVFSNGGQNEHYPEILSEKCNGCGACSTRCPTDALSFQYINELQPWIFPV